jgi:UDP-N-acetylglucosamine 2-epimerase (non-hydrolysing)
MRVMTVLGTRPEIIRLCRVIELLDESCEHLLVHTGQNYEECLSGLFLRELGVRDPDLFLGVSGGCFGEQVGQLFAAIEPVLRERRPDRLLILGDTNSGLAAVVARRLGIPVYHMEAGNRCHDDRVPEEVNRRVIDHCSTVHMPYTRRSKENLVREGIDLERIFVTGNPIKEVMDHFGDRVEESSVLEQLALEERRYLLVTMHRAENVDDAERLSELVESLAQLHAEHSVPIICSFHPRTRAKVKQFGVRIERAGLRFLEPFGFFDFVKLERSALCILSDSGTVQEEACIMRVPNVTIREVTERPETVECGSNVLSGCTATAIREKVRLVLRQRDNWEPPPEYLVPHVASTVAQVVLGYRIPDLAEHRWRTQSTV